ncbi:MAG TPA: hypothetical protein PKY77_24390 [Phycisphaerae bacterium]|nr:hypothetical protein [Phycisphaerae bacterium]HRY71003.1 hypothetical protein [Phycisphaerae bacterium]HSA29295.1 hypothetical protein [Phycisphaerae bacterium]
MPLAAFLGWLVPGAGHLFIGERARGTIFLVVIGLTFWSGIAIGGVKNTVNSKDRFLWFLGQVCAGAHPIVAMTWGKHSGAPETGGDPGWYAYGHTEDTAVVYTAIAGMLNLLAIFDVLARIEKGTGQESRAAPAASRRAGP